MKYLAFCLLWLLALSSCSSPTSPTPSTNIWQSPNNGSTYVYALNSTDTSSDGTVSNSNGAATLMVEATNLHIDDKTNVTKFISQGPFYFAYEANGDVSIGDSSSSGYTWMTYPIASKRTITDLAEDTTDFSGYRIQHSRTRSYVGDETITIGGRNFNAVHIRQSESRIYSPPDASSDVTTTLGDWYYVPEIKFFAKWSIVETSDSPGSTPYHSGYTTNVELSLFSLK